MTTLRDILTDFENEIKENSDVEFLSSPEPEEVLAKYLDKIKRVIFDTYLVRELEEMARAALTEEFSLVDETIENIKERIIG